ncbi:hypothetical protein SLNWT_0387 [Streptomyces albus]|uniref:DUF6879 domain-containing protein n=1 Tax=Streptomyces albus (strain ATCC 21838 / DSM 41398 / FERM P-419 / JCM 4703 / NBRC 107858) TaxID=1081613 RepID=A0A0B5EFH1_STRA4|nr:hypothetical protein SLNWT_0387 [Streptomyces albus]AOU75074.1 hypothetical protein SLNHY_0383 [Streptomyces albus]AYN30881.1 hypothetical protein DUI70_0378 [Streptomyces albus]
MARQLRFNGTGSGEGGCPAVHEDLDSGEIIVHGPPLEDPADIAQLKHLDEGEVAVVVPRNTLVDFGPRDERPRIIDLDAFGRLFERFEHTAWRLETRGRYASDEATTTYAQFLAGEQPTWDLHTPWSETIRTKTSNGARVERVRVVDSPATDGQRYLSAHVAKNAALGEDIRNISRVGAEQNELGAEDFWIFDSRIVAILRFDEDDRFTEVELVTEPARVLRYVQLRDVARHFAIPSADFPLG